MKKIIWTRSSEDWQQDQALLNPPKGVEIVSMPLLRFEPLAVNLTENIPQYVIVTSQKTTHFIASQKHRLEQFRKADCCFLTFGSKTLKSLQALQLKTQFLPAIGGESFAQEILKQLEPSEAWFLAADRPAVRVDELLNQQGWQVVFKAVYRSLPVTEVQAEQQALFNQSPSGLVVCFASPYAVEGFASLAERQQWRDWQSISVATIGPTTAESCENYFSKVATAESATIESLFDLALQQFHQEND